MPSSYDKLINFVTTFASDYIIKDNNTLVIIFTRRFDFRICFIHLNITISGGDLVPFKDFSVIFDVFQFT